MSEPENTPEVPAKVESESTSESPESAENSPELLKKIITQLEYYYGDYNLPRDRFLKQQTELDNGWVPLDLMMKFSRLSKLAKTAATIGEALEKEKSELLELSEDKTKLRRNPDKPCPVYDEAAQKEVQKRTIYAKGFPADSELDELLQFFTTFGETENVQMRSFRAKDSKTLTFKGSVFAVFKSVEDATKFMELENVQYKEKELIRKWQSAYNDEKRLERIEKFSKSGKKGHAEGENQQEEEEKVPDIPSGCFLLVKGVYEDLDREELKQHLQDKCDCTVGFIDMEKNKGEAYVRLQGKDSAASALEKLGEGAKLEIQDNTMTVHCLTPEEEKPLIDKARQFMKLHRKGMRGGGKRRRGGSRGNWRDTKRARTNNK